MSRFQSISFLLLTVTLLYSCKKDPEGLAASTVQLNMSVQNDSMLLSWSVIGNKESFNGYSVYVRTDPDDTSETLVALVHDMSYTHRMPVSSYVAYRVSANYFAHGSTTNHKVYSNYVVHNRSDVALYDIDPMDALYDNGILYVFDGNSTIAKYDMSAHQIVKQVSLGGTITYPDIGVHNGQKEIYVPGTDGWIDVLNTNLDKMDEIYVGAEAYSVVYHGGYLFTTIKAGTLVKTDGKPMTYYLHVYNRTTKQLVNNSNNNVRDNAERIKKIPGTDVEFFGVVGNAALTPANNIYDLHYYKYDANGHYLTGKKDESYYLVTPIIMETYPDGSKMVTGMNGCRFGKNLMLGGMFSDGEISGIRNSAFGFNVAEDQIYTGLGRAINVVNMSDNTVQRTIKTLGYPHKIFFDAGKIICVSRNSYPASVGESGMIERSPFMVEVFQ